MPDDRPASSKAGTYSITAIDTKRGSTALAAGMSFRQAFELRARLLARWPDVTFIVEPDTDPALYAHFPAVYQIVGVKHDCSRTPLMGGLTLDKAEATRDEMLKAEYYLWIWIEREPG